MTRDVTWRIVHWPVLHALSLVISSTAHAVDVCYVDAAAAAAASAAAAAAELIRLSSSSSNAY